MKKLLFLLMIVSQIAFAQKPDATVYNSATIVRTANQPGVNTADRIGGLFQDLVYGKLSVLDYSLATGTNNYSATVSPAIVGYVAGQVFKIQFQNANTASSQLNLNSLGSVLITSDGSTSLSSGTIKAGQMFWVYYNGTAFQLVGGAGGSSYTADESTLHLSGTVFSINTAYTGQTSITTLGTLTTGTWNATKIGLSYGGTNADLSATGGTSQVLKQTSVGGNITVGQLAASDLSNGTTGSGSVVLATSPTLVTPALGTPTSLTLTNATGLPVTSLSGSWTNLTSTLTGTAPYRGLNGTYTATGTVTDAYSTNPWIITSGVTTGTDATSGIDYQANSLTTGYGMNLRSSSITTGRLLRVNSTSTAINHTIGSSSLARVSMSGANGSSSMTAVGFESNVSNTGTSSTNVAAVFNASGGTNNYAVLVPNGSVGIGTNTPAANLEVYQQTALTTGVNNAVAITHSTSATPAAGIGSNILGQVQTDAGGSQRTMVDLEFIATDVTSSAQDGAFLIKLMSNGVAPSSASIYASGNLTTLTESSATAFARINLSSGQSTSGTMEFYVNADDGTDYQNRTITFPFAVVNKGGTLTLSTISTTESVAASSGTLTCTITFVDSGSGNADFKANCTSSLTQTTLNGQFQLRKQIPGTVTPQ